MSSRVFCQVRWRLLVMTVVEGLDGRLLLPHGDELLRALEGVLGLGKGLPSAEVAAHGGNDSKACKGRGGGGRGRLSCGGQTRATRRHHALRSVLRGGGGGAHEHQEAVSMPKNGIQLPQRRFSASSLWSGDARCRCCVFSDPLERGTEEDEHSARPSSLTDPGAEADSSAQHAKGWFPWSNARVISGHARRRWVSSSRRRAAREQRGGAAAPLPFVGAPRAPMRCRERVANDAQRDLRDRLTWDGVPGVAGIPRKAAGYRQRKLFLSGDACGG